MASPTRSQVLVTPPTVEPVGELELAAHVRELDLVEQYCRRALLEQTWQLTLDRFPCASAGSVAASYGPGPSSFLRIPRAPLRSVTFLKYLDSSGALTTWANTNYTVDTASLPGRVHLAYGIIWPSTQWVANAVQLEYTAGYGTTAAAVPEPIKHAIKLLVGHWYQIREPAITGTIITKVPFSVEALLGPYRVLEV
jgi:uncharacterized phiE125 gp8 family phage protein